MRFQSFPSCLWWVHQKGFCFMIWYCLNSWRILHPLSNARVSLSLWKRVLIRGTPLDQLSSRSSWVSLRFSSSASFLFKAYSYHTLLESLNSLSQLYTYLYKFGMSRSSSCDIPCRKWVIFDEVCREYFKSAWGIRMCPMLSIPKPPSSFGV